MRPAWSEQFDPQTLPRVAALPLPAAITREWAWGDSTGRGVKIAVIDSGIDASHPAVGHVAGGAAFTLDQDAEDGVAVEEGPHDDLYGHGTACAGIIRALAPDVELYSVRVLGANLSGKGLVFAAGLRWAIEQGMRVANLSLSTKSREYFALLHELSDQAYFQRTMLVSAVNNVPAASYPSLYSSVFSVAARPGDDPLAFDYNPSPPVEFGARGIDVPVAWTGDATVTATGNSFAAPHVAGLIARILGRHPGLAPFEVKTILRALAANTT